MQRRVRRSHSAPRRSRFLHSRRTTEATGSKRRCRSHIFTAVSSITSSPSRRRSRTSCGADDRNVVWPVHGLAHELSCAASSRHSARRLASPTITNSSCISSSPTRRADRETGSFGRRIAPTRLAAHFQRLTRHMAFIGGIHMRTVVDTHRRRNRIPLLGMLWPS